MTPTAATPSVEQARVEYLDLAHTAAQIDCWCRDMDTTPCGSWLWLDVDAASIRLDLAVAEHVARKSVAW